MIQNWPFYIEQRDAPNKIASECTDMGKLFSEASIGKLPPS